MTTTFVITTLVYLLHSALFTAADVHTNISTEYTDNISFLIYGQSAYVYDQIRYNDCANILSSSYYNSSLASVFYFPGWGADPIGDEEGSAVTLATAFLSLGGVNVLAMRYYDLITKNGSELFPPDTPLDLIPSYVDAVHNVSYIGQAIGDCLGRLVRAGLHYKGVHLIGHSLGCPIIAKTARTLSAVVGEIPPWITGLDPAGPLFNHPWSGQLTASDARFVDVYHTDGGAAGTPFDLGTMDFYPNFGAPVQPYCNGSFIDIDQQACSHSMAWKYYAISVNRPHIFPAVRCNSGLEFVTHFCKYSNLNLMGYGVNKRGTKGTYYLQTGSEPPFGLGRAGIWYSIKNGQ